MLLLQRVRSAEEPRGPVFRQRNARDDMSRSGLSNWYPYLAVPLTIITDSACMTSMTWVSNAVPKFEQDPTPSAERLLSDPATTPTTRNVPNADSGDERIGHHLNALTLSIHSSRATRQIGAFGALSTPFLFRTRKRHQRKSS